MTRGISEEKIAVIQGLYRDKIPIKEICEITGDSYSTVYSHTRLKERGFVSRDDYNTDLNEIRQRLPKNRRLGEMINGRLKSLRKNKGWLSGKTGISRERISQYAKGSYFPREDALIQLCCALRPTARDLEFLFS